MDDKSDKEMDSSSSVRTTRERECKQSLKDDNGSDSNSNNKRKTRSAKTIPSTENNNNNNKIKCDKKDGKDKTSDCDLNGANDLKEDKNINKTVNGVVSEADRIIIKEENIKKEDEEMEHSSIGGNYCSVSLQNWLLLFWQLSWVYYSLN